MQCCCRSHVSLFLLCSLTVNIMHLVGSVYQEEEEGGAYLKFSRHLDFGWYNPGGPQLSHQVLELVVRPGTSRPVEICQTWERLPRQERGVLLSLSGDISHEDVCPDQSDFHQTPFYTSLSEDWGTPQPASSLHFFHTLLGRHLFPVAWKNKIPNYRWLSLSILW